MKQFNHVGSINPGRSAFNLSYEKKFDCDMGQLIPVMCDEVVPGDIFTIGNQSVIRFNPLVAPVMHEVTQYVHYYFVPYRLLWEDWEDFITGGRDGDDASVIPTWTPTDTAIGSLWDYLGFPTGIIPAGTLPIDFPRRAYNFIYNEYYRDENHIDEVALTNQSILLRAWEKDYFTSALLTQQRGVAPSLPISGYAPVHGIAYHGNQTTVSNITGYETDGTGSIVYANAKPSDVGPNSVIMLQDDPNNPGFPNVRADLSTATTFDVADLRFVFQIQKWMERNQRCGVRYTEFLGAHFGVNPRDDRLQRPEYIGGSKAPIIFSEVLQTSSTDGTSPQGNLAGHGISVCDQFCGKYRAQEYGLIMGIMSVMPRSSFNSQGVNRQWLRATRYDFYFPEFANLSEQAIVNGELCARNNDATHNAGIFGYQGRYDEMRVKQNLVCGNMRSTFDYWHMAREFDPASPPALNQAFIECVPRKDIFAVPAEPGMIVQFGNIIKAIRPLPIMSQPGLIDHN